MMPQPKTIMTRDIINIALLGILSLVLSLGLLIFVVCIFTFIPIHLSPFVYELFPLYQKGVLPEREMAFYRFFIFSNIVLQSGLVYWFRKRLDDQTLSRDILFFLRFELMWILLQIFAVFKILLYNNPTWAMYLFYIALGFSTVSKIFWPEFRRGMEWLMKNYQDLIRNKAMRYVCAGLVVLLIASVIYVRDVERILGFIMAWGNWDQFKVWRSQSILSSLDDVRFLHCVMAATIVYFVLMFIFMRFWLNSLLLAAGAVFLAIKWQLFHLGISPIIWQYPQKLDPMQLIDLLLFALLLAYTKLGRKTLFWIAVVGLTMEGGRYLWLALHGPDTIPLYVCLRERNFFAYVWQFAIPIMYTLTFLTQIRRRKENAVILAACLFGLAVFSNHVKDSTITNYYTHSLPLVMVIAFWVKQLIDRLSNGRAMILKVIWAGIFAVALLTNNLFMVYPNVFNAGNIKWDQVKIFYQQRTVKP